MKAEWKENGEMKMTKKVNFEQFSELQKGIKEYLDDRDQWGAHNAIGYIFILPATKHPTGAPFFS